MADLRREERDEKRKKKNKRQRKTLFNHFLIVKNLERILPSGNMYTRSSIINYIREAMTLISNDPRFIIIVGDRERERLFYEFNDQRTRKERDEARKRRREGMENFRQFLETNKAVTVDTQWRIFKDQVEDNPVFKDIDKLDSLTVFMEYIKELESKDIERLKLEKVERRTRSRKCREAYRNLLDECWAARKINVKTRWKDFKPLVKNENRFTDLLEDDVEGSTPAELFYDLIEDLEERYHKEKKESKEILKEAQIVIHAQFTYENFFEVVNKHEYFKLLDEANLIFLYSDLQEKAVKVEEKSKKKIKKKFLSVLKNIRISKSTTWDEIKGTIASSLESIPLSDSEQKDLFDEHYQKRNDEDDFDSTSEEEEGAIKERRVRSSKKDKERKHRSSRKKRDSDRRKESDSSDDEDDSKHKKGAIFKCTNIV